MRPLNCVMGSPSLPRISKAVPGLYVPWLTHLSSGDCLCREKLAELAEYGASRCKQDRGAPLLPAYAVSLVPVSRGKDLRQICPMLVIYLVWLVVTCRATVARTFTGPASATRLLLA